MELFLIIFILLSEYANPLCHLSTIFHFYGFVLSHSPTLVVKWPQDFYSLSWRCYTSQPNGFFSSERPICSHRIGISGNVLETSTHSEEVWGWFLRSLAILSWFRLAKSDTLNKGWKYSGKYLMTWTSPVGSSNAQPQWDVSFWKYLPQQLWPKWKKKKWNIFTWHFIISVK